MKLVATFILIGCLVGIELVALATLGCDLGIQFDSSICSKDSNITFSLAIIVAICFGLGLLSAIATKCTKRPSKYATRYLSVRSGYIREEYEEQIEISTDRLRRCIVPLLLGLLFWLITFYKSPIPHTHEMAAVIWYMVVQTIDDPYDSTVAHEVHVAIALWPLWVGLLGSTMIAVRTHFKRE